eukprot:1159576-Pelagomonas_calceolata.AAC.9
MSGRPSSLLAPSRGCSRRTEFSVPLRLMQSAGQAAAACEQVSAVNLNINVLEPAEICRSQWQA